MSAPSPAGTALPAPRPKADRIGVAALIVGTAIIAWSGTLARLLDVGPLAGAAWRMGLAVPALAAWTRLAQRGPTPRPDLAASAGLLVVAGLAFALDVGSFHLAVNGASVANATFIGNVAPILTVVGGALIFHERPPPRVWLALGLALFGAWIMAGMLAPARVGSGDAFALSAAVAYAGYLLTIKRLRQRLDAATATLWSAAVAAIVLAVAARLRGETMVPSSAFGWMIVALLGFVTHATGQGLTSVAMGRAPVGLVALVLLAQPPVSALIAWLALGEAMTPLQLAGGAIILISVLLSGPSASGRRAPASEMRRR